MDPSYIFLRVVLLPAAICAGAWLVGRFAAARARDALAALGVAAGFCAALWALGTRPSLPLAPYEDAWQWVFWFAPAAAILGIAGPFVRAPEIARVLLRFAAGAGAAWLLLRPFVPHALTVREALGRAAAAGLVAEIVWTALAFRAKRGGSLAHALPLLAAIGGGAAILLEYGRSLVMAEACGALAAAVGASALLVRWRGGPALPAVVAPVIALVFVGLLLGAHAHLNYGDTVRFPLASGLLLAASAACVFFPRAWLATGLAVVLAAAATVLADRLGTTTASYF